MRPRLLFYAMYDPGEQNSAPKVRIALLGAALEEQAEVSWLSGNRTARARQLLTPSAVRRLVRTDAAYVELSTVPPSPVDLAFLALLRALGRPVGVYFRDAHQRFRGLFPIRRRRQRLSDLVWRLTTPLLARIATRRFVPSEGLARVLGLSDAILLPPGMDPGLPVLGAGSEPLVAAIVPAVAGSGFEELVEAVRLVRADRPDVRLRVVSSTIDPSVASELPDWVELCAAARPALAAVLGPARVCVLPLPINAYTDIAVPVRLMDLLAFGKPIVATRSAETRRVLEPTGAGLLVADAPAAIAGAISRILEEPALAETLSSRARAVAESADWSWGARATRVLDELLPAAAGRGRRRGR